MLWTDNNPNSFVTRLEIEKSWTMKIFAAIFSLASAQGSCNWIWGNSGDRLECLPNFYIDGICESGRRDDCGWVNPCGESDQLIGQIGKNGWAKRS